MPRAGRAPRGSARCRATWCRRTRHCGPSRHPLPHRHAGDLRYGSPDRPRFSDSWVAPGLRLSVDLRRCAHARAAQATDDQPAAPRCNGADSPLWGVDRGEFAARRRQGNADGGVQRRAEGMGLLRAPEARVAESDRPRVGHVTEALRRAVRERLRTLATELVQAVAEAVPLVAELRGETAGVEVRTPRTVLVERAAIRERRPAERIERR